MFKITKFKIQIIILLIIFSLNTSIIPANAECTRVIIGGEPFGLKLYCKGVMVLRLEDFISGGKKVCPAAESGIKVNDIITKSDDKTIKNNEQFSEIIKKSKGKTLNIRIIRNNKTLKRSLKAVKNQNGEYYTGMWIRDSCAGLGTISYYNTANMTYGALGHGICDADTGGFIESKSGETTGASISGVSKSRNNNIGTLNGYFTDKKIGTIKKNTPLGIYGSLSALPLKKNLYSIADEDEIIKGDAYIYTTVQGEIPKKYKIEITEICNTDLNSNRNFIIKIKDKKLLNKTNGIVQGMSGSPIVQNGKFVGALTHVFLDDCTIGYAVLAKNMIKN